MAQLQQPGMPEPQKEPIQQAGEQLITQLLQVAMGNPQMLIGLALSGAAREVSQLTGLTRRRQGGTGPGGNAMPTAATLLAGNRGDVDRLMALQQLMQQAPGVGGPGPLAQLGSQVAPIPQGVPGMGAPVPNQGMMPGMPPGALPLPVGPPQSPFPSYLGGVL